MHRKALDYFQKALFFIFKMAGIYIHIPFCKTRCIYCGFYSTTDAGLRSRYVDALLQELALRTDYLDEPVETIYLGGGTPSQLDTEDLQRLLNGVGKSDILKRFESSRVHEITIECNPDDVTLEYAHELKALGVNRVSMGVQTFSDERLRFLRRRHTAQQARQAVATLRQAGIENISIDLMFGFPDETLSEWHSDIDEALSLDVEHISAYSLMYEEGTPLHAMLERGNIREISDEQSSTMYYTLIDRLTSAGYEHYEISNFARPGRRSRHNSSYWTATPYLGLGAGAHSYDRQSRQWNVSNLRTYINKVEHGVVPFERETLDETTKYNDMITTALRTREGLLIDDAGPLRDYLLHEARPLIERGLLNESAGRLRLTRRALFVSDDVMSELIFTD